MKKARAIGAFCLAFFVLLLLVSEAALRYRGDLILHRPKCSQLDPKEILSLTPNCDSWEESPPGPYRFHTNEDGFRDRPREFFRDGAIFFLGDSHVEGFRLPEEQGLSRQLEVALGRKVLNLGMQGLGPGQEQLRAMRALENYRPTAAVWQLNPNDTIDEIYFEAIRAGEPNPLLDPELRTNLIGRLANFFRGRSRLVAKLNELWNQQRPYTRFLSGRKFDPAIHCRSIRELSAAFGRKKVPLVFLLLGQGPKGSRQAYRGVDIVPADFDAMVGCVKKTGDAVIDLRESFPDPADYWPGDWHFTPAGTLKLAHLLADRLKATLPSAR